MSGEVVITCHFSSCPVPSWRGPSLASTGRVTVVTSESRESVLTISKVLEEDEGQYYCGCDGSESAPSTLIIRRKLHLRCSN